MPALQVRDFPQDLYDALKARAAAEHRSMAQQTIKAVEDMLARESGGREGARRPHIVRFETPEERQARIEKRKAIFAKAAERAKENPIDIETVLRLCRESRDELDQRSDRALAILEGSER